MTAPRHDIYNAVHKAIRANLFATTTQLAACDFTDADERTQAVDAARTSLRLLDEHAALEDEFLIPKVNEASASVGANLAAAHEQLDAAGAACRDLVEGIASSEDAVARSRDLCHTFYALTALHLEHMNVEETEANIALWEAFDDVELRALQGRMLASIPPDSYAAWLRLILPAINVHERVGMMRGMKASAPPEAFERVMKIGREVVGERWGAVETALA